jgi:crossover junction endodeoxyribonuclease RuvC
MTTILAIDPSLAATGLAWWVDGRTRVTTVCTSPRDRDEDRWHRIAMAILTRRDPTPGKTIAVIEGRITPGEDAVQTAMDLAELRGVIRYGLHQCRIPVAEMHPSTLKLWATGNGRASKQSMMDAARGRLGHVAHCQDDNQADALWLLAAALHHYGAFPLWRPPVKNLRALSTPAWPAFTIERTTINA